MKIATVIGARPQFVKAAVISRLVHSKKYKAQGVDEVLIHTGQHYDANISEIFFEQMAMPEPDYNLGIQASRHGAMTGRMLEELEEVLIQENPDVALVYGDTNSTLAGALAAVKLHIPIAHVEAGLRSFNRRMPEEINRLLTDQVSHWLFCPTTTAANHLRREGISETKIYNVGDVMYDAVLHYRRHCKPSATIEERIKANKDFCLATVHRAENTDDPQRLESIVTALDQIANETSVLLPLHPRTQKLLNSQNKKFTQVQVIDPVGYFDILALLEECQAVFTDSGGLQKEAYFFSKPCITLRDETEWTELVEEGFNLLVGADRERILKAFEQAQTLSIDSGLQLFGDGHAGEKILDKMLEPTSRR